MENTTAYTREKSYLFIDVHGNLCQPLTAEGGLHTIIIDSMGEFEGQVLFSGMMRK